MYYKTHTNSMYKLQASCHEYYSVTNTDEGFRAETL